MKGRTCLLFGFLSALAVPSGEGFIGAAGASGAGPGRITVHMQPCQATRESVPKSRFDALARVVKSLLDASAGPDPENLVKRGVVEVDGKKYTLYLPKAQAYSVRNTGKRDHVFENTSTRLAIDQKGDGKLAEMDNWFANLPVRLGDRMYEVAEIAADGSRVVLQASKAPLSGAIVDRSCPPFSFKTTDGKTVSRDVLAGKPFLLDIWSIT